MTEMLESAAFNSVCNDCGEVKEGSYDGKQCDCGGIFHVNSARCSACGMRHPFSAVGGNCSCAAHGAIVPKTAVCPKCGKRHSSEECGQQCENCRIDFILEG